MKQTLIAAALFWGIGSVWAQTPSAQDVQQAQEAVNSGALQVTPEAIEAAKELFPDLKDVSNEKILKQADEVQGKDPAEIAAEVEKARQEAEAKSNEETAKETGQETDATESDLVRRTTSNVPGSGQGPSAGGFPGGLRRFGEEFFSNVDAGGGLGPNAPSLPEYILSPGDELEISVWGRDSRTQTVTIDADGMFKYPPLDPFRIAGRRFDEAQKIITSEIQKIHGLSVAVRLGRLKSIRVMVLGEASKPGSYALPAGITVTAALFRSGGVSPIGSMRNIEVRRNGRVVSRFDVYEMLLKGDMRSDIQLLPGDAIFIPLAKIQVAVTGNVKRPAIYEVKPGFKALDVIELAGGLDFDAFKGRVRLDRVQNNQRHVVIDVDLDKMDARSNVRLADGDVLNVEKVLGRIEDAVFLEGNVNRPGRYQYKKGMTVRDLVPSLKALKPETYFEYGHIRRPAPDDDRPLLLSFSLSDVLTRGARVPLQPRDVVVIYNRYQLSERPSVSSAGALRNPGTFLYREGMTISDLVILSGGLKDAYLPETHVRRMVADVANDSVYTELIRVNLKAVLENPRSAENLVLQPFDAYRVYPRSAFQNTSPVRVTGPVRSPGSYPVSDNLRISDLVTMAGGLTDGAHTLQAHLRREAYDRERDSLYTVLLQVNLRGALEQPRGEHDLVLRAADALTIFHRSTFTYPQTVSISGQVRNPGSFNFVEHTRLSDLIVMAGGLNGDVHLAEAHLRRRVYDSARDSVYTELVRVNLRSVLDNPSGEDNLVLRSQDAFHVFPRTMFEHPSTVAIFGAVRNPGTHELTDNMAIPDLVKLAGGLTKTSYKLEVELVRRSVVNDSVVERSINRMNLRDIMDGKESFALQDGDGLYIREIIRSRESMQVTLSGEFKFPGVYEFVEGETLSSVIKRAGGFTNDAYLRGTVFLRERVKQQQLRHAAEVSRRLEGQLQGMLMQSTVPTDRASITMAIERNKTLLAEIESAPYLGRVIVKVDKRLKFAGTDWDLRLESGDRITVGPNVSTVSVLGEVYSPTTVIHTRRTNTIGKVLKKAGGVNLYGDYKATMYVDPDGSITTPRTTPWYGSFRGHDVQPGGTVVVPLKPPAKDYLEAWVKGTQILYQLAISVGVVSTLF